MKQALLACGFVLVAAGCFLHYPPLAFVVVGSLLLAAAVGSHFYSAQRRPPQ
jgi:hypothetical protein